MSIDSLSRPRPDFPLFCLPACLLATVASSVFAFGNTYFYEVITCFYLLAFCILSSFSWKSYYLLLLLHREECFVSLVIVRISRRQPVHSVRKMASTKVITSKLSHRLLAMGALQSYTRRTSNPVPLPVYPWHQ